MVFVKNGVVEGVVFISSCFCNKLYKHIMQILILGALVGSSLLTIRTRIGLTLAARGYSSLSNNYKGLQFYQKFVP